MYVGRHTLLHFIGNMLENLHRDEDHKNDNNALEACHIPVHVYKRDRILYRPFSKAWRKLSYLRLPSTRLCNILVSHALNTHANA